MSERQRRPDGVFLPSHGGTRTRLYKIWLGMIQRCINPRNQKFRIYGQRGIHVDEEWLSFVPFRNWAFANGYSATKQIDRIDTDGHYTASNCRWVTSRENNNNRRNNHLLTAFGETKTVAEWARDPRCKATIGAVYQRLRKNCPPELALSLLNRSGSSVRKRVARATN